MESVPLQQLATLAGCILIAGTLLTLPIYKFDYKKFTHSYVFVKILFWIPIFMIFIGLLCAGNAARLAVLLTIILIAIKEFYAVYKNTRGRYLLAYGMVFIIGMLHLVALGSNFQGSFTSILITLCLSTVLADVAAYFAGNYLGRHKLPDRLNNHKSWEGVAGEVVGSLAGVLLVNYFVIPVSTVWMFLPIGIGSAVGDLANSYVKRRVGIQQWSRAIPGHGGFVDRFCSLAGSAALLFYFLEVIG